MPAPQDFYDEVSAWLRRQTVRRWPWAVRERMQFDLDPPREVGPPPPPNLHNIIQSACPNCPPPTDPVGPGTTTTHSPEMPPGAFTHRLQMYTTDQALQEWDMLVRRRGAFYDYTDLFTEDTIASGFWSERVGTWTINVGDGTASDATRGAGPGLTAYLQYRGYDNYGDVSIQATAANPLGAVTPVLAVHTNIDGSNGYYAEVASSSAANIYVVTAGVPLLLASTPLILGPNFTMRFIALGSTLALLIDDVLAVQVDDETYASGSVGLANTGAAQEIFSTLVIVDRPTAIA